MIELLVAGATLTLAAWAAGADAHRRHAASRALDRYAVSRGLVFIPAPVRNASPRVVGAKDGIAFVIDLYRLNGEMRTRVVGEARSRSAKLEVGQAGAFAWPHDEVITLGEARFDIMSGDAEVVRDAAAPLVILHELRRGIWLRSDGHKVAISWRGVESDPVVLDAARDAVVLVAGSHRPENPYR